MDRHNEYFDWSDAYKKGPRIRPRVFSLWSQIDHGQAQRTPQEQWQSLVDKQRDSGLSAMQFCKQEDICYV